MRAVLGIGNPGKRYQNTKHNIGFILLDYLADEYKIKFAASGYDFYYTEGIIEQSEFVLVKPATYVNQSGVAAADLLKKYSLNSKDILVVHDDLNLELGQIKIKQSGGDGGHNGIVSIIYHLATDQFPRLRFGIGRKFQQGEMADYVLSKFSNDDFAYIEPSIKLTGKLIEEFIKGGTKQVLDYYSQVVKSAQNHTSTTDPNEEKS